MQAGFPSDDAHAGSGTDTHVGARAQRENPPAVPAITTDLQISRRNLPHWQVGGSTYFITWRTLNDRVLHPDERDIFLATIKHFNCIQYDLFIAVVMPDHIHTLIQPLERKHGEWFSLASIIKSMKGVSARKINQLNDQLGSLWQDVRYDRIVRNQLEFEEKFNYIRDNPAADGLCSSPKEYPWLEVWSSPQGWLPKKRPPPESD